MGDEENKGIILHNLYARNGMFGNGSLMTRCRRARKQCTVVGAADEEPLKSKLIVNRRTGLISYN